MNRTAQALPLRRTADLMAGAAAVAAVGAVIWLNDFSNSCAFLAIFIPALLPAWLWLRKGAPGMPILPVVSLFYVLYFATPILTGAVNNAAAEDILRAGLTVGGFLLAAAWSWRLVVLRALRKNI